MTVTDLDGLPVACEARAILSRRGTHLLVECRGCRADVLDDADLLVAALHEAADAIGARVVGMAFHAFEPQGVTGVLILAESHIAIHTWPEHGYAAVDLFTCGASDPRKALPILRQALACELTFQTIERSVLGT